MLLVLGAGLALWPGYDRMSDRSDSSDPFLMTKPVLPENAEVQALQPWAPANSTVSTGPKIDGGKPESQAGKNSAAGFGLAGRDPDFQACETASGDDGIAACDRAIASGKFTGRNLSYLYSDRGFMRMQKGEVDRALADLNEAARIDSSNFYAFWNRGAVYTAKGELDRAREEFTTALALNPDKTSKAKIEEALNAVVASAKAANAPPSDKSVITDPSKFWGAQEGVAGSAASSYPTDAMPAFPAAEEPAPAMPAAPSMGPAVAPPDR